MSDEIIDICNENNEIIETSLRTEAHKKGLWHRTSHVWIYNSQKEIFLQLRAKEKKFFPDMWDLAVAGHITTGELPDEVALRETLEEIGLEIRKEDLDFIEIRKQQYLDKDVIENVFHYVFLLKYNGEIEKLQLQSEEVQDIYFIPIETLEKELTNNSHRYTPRGSYWNEIIQAIKTRT